MEYKEEDYLQLSGLQHFIFCRRQWALIHIENQWKDNLLTTEDNILHERAHDESFSEKRGSILILRGLRVSSSTLGVSGQCDVVEFHQADDGIPIQGQAGLWKVFPVEYKRGRPKKDLADEAQICAEAMCLEEMLNTSIPVGALFYGENRRRTEVIFTEDLRKLVRDSLFEMHSLFQKGYTPKGKPSKKCSNCSLREICLPGITNRQSVYDYVRSAICENS